MELTDEVRKHRKPDHDVHGIFLNRWSPRSMTGEPLEHETLLSLFEAARWSPSARNEQPWRFIYAHRGTEHWDGLFDLLVEGNQSWCKDAAALIVVVSRKIYAHKSKPNGSHTLDTGMAVQNLMLEAASRGLVAHPMAGFDKNRAQLELGVPDDYRVECMIAVGVRGPVGKLPQEFQEREHPSDRRPTVDSIMEGKCKEK